MRGIGHSGDRECAVVTGHADAGGGYELAEDESMRGGGLNRRGCGSRGATAGSGEAWSASDGGELLGRGRGDDGKRSVVAGEAEAPKGNRLGRRKAMAAGWGGGSGQTGFG